MLQVYCHQIPSALAVIRALGIFYAWHPWQALTLARIACAI